MRSVVAFITATVILSAAGVGIAATRVGTDHETGIKLRLDGRTLTAILPKDRQIRKELYGTTTTAGCGTQIDPGKGTLVYQNRRWPKGRSSLRYRLKQDISARARICFLERDGGIDMARVRFKRRK